MDQTHLHLLTNHISLFGLVFGLIILAIGLFRKSQDLKLGATIIFLLAGLMIIPAYQTGEDAEDRVEKITGVNEHDIEEHEEAANWARVVTLALGAISLYALIRYRKDKTIPKGLSIAMLLVALFGFSVVARTAYLGGFIRHSEIHQDATTPPAESEQ